jgi:hypothetical protein
MTEKQELTEVELEIKLTHDRRAAIEKGFFKKRQVK